jgi:hypothetical protein
MAYDSYLGGLNAIEKGFTTVVSPLFNFARDRSSRSSAAHTPASGFPFKSFLAKSRRFLSHLAACRIGGAREVKVLECLHDNDDNNNNNPTFSFAERPSI